MLKLLLRLELHAPRISPGALPVHRQNPIVGFKGQEGRNGRGRERGGEDGYRGRDEKVALLLSQTPGSTHGCGFKNIETLDSYTC